MACPDVGAQYLRLKFCRLDKYPRLIFFVYMCLMCCVYIYNVTLCMLFVIERCVGQAEGASNSDTTLLVMLRQQLLSLYADAYSGTFDITDTTDMCSLS